MTGKASRRLRDLPARVLVCHVIALALSMTSSTREVMRCLLEDVRWLWRVKRNLRLPCAAGLAGLLLWATSVHADSAIAGGLRWAVYYGDTASAASFDDYDLVVLDSNYPLPLQPLRDRGKQVLGYVSAGELEKERPYFSTVAEKNVLLKENPNWPGSYIVDIRDDRWSSFILEDVIPSILHKGFTGVMIDTLDSPIFLEESEPDKYLGMKEAAVRLVRAIERNYPQARIAVNRAYEILPRIAGTIDFALAEAVWSGYDFEKKRPRQVSRAEYAEQVELLQGTARQHPALTVLSLDYWDPEDAPGMAAIYRLQRENGFAPYVATVELDRVVPEPKP